MMNEISQDYLVLPYSMLVRQESLRLALELMYISPDIGGVLASGQRGTAKSTTVRSFARMAHGELPVTLPIGATEDRVIGGWDVQELVKGSAALTKEGLLVQASKSAARMLYVDEVNLLDDFLVNIILDTLSTGHLSVQRDHLGYELESVRFSLVGTMNPDEGGLRPQLLDRFGLVIQVDSEDDPAVRGEILESVLAFEEERTRYRSTRLEKALDEDRLHRAKLEAARRELPGVRYDEQVVQLCATLAAAFRVPGHRGELVLMRAARALAAWRGCAEVLPEHVQTVAKPALIHRRSATESTTLARWTEEQDALVAKVVGRPDVAPQ